MAKERERGTNGMGSIFKRKDGLYAATISLGYEGGKRKRQTFYGKTQGEVSDQLKKALHKQQTGLPVAVPRQTVGQYLQRWLKDCIEPSDLGLRTKLDYSQIVKQHLEPELGRKVLAKLAAPDIQTMLNRKKAAGLSPRRCQYIHAVLRAALAQAERWDLVPRNVAKLVQAKGGKQTEIKPFTPEEARTFLSAIRGHRLEALFVTTLTLGLRQREALGLQWGDVDLTAGTISVRHTLIRLGGKTQLGEPKTGRSKRTLRLPQMTVDALRTHRTNQIAERLMTGPYWQDTGFIFTSHVGTPLDAGNVSREYHKVRRAAGLRHQRFHDLRHAAASFWLAQGASLRDVMGILGHSQIALTANLYTHLLPAVTEQAAARMDALLGAV